MIETVILIIGLMMALGAPLVASRFGLQGSLLALLLVSTGVAARFFGPAPLSTYTVAVLLLFAAFLLADGFNGGGLWTFAPFSLYLIFGVGYLWRGVGDILPAIVALLISVLAWPIGRSVRASIGNDGSRFVPSILWTVLFIACVQVLISSLQVIGLEIFVSQTVNGEFTEGRANGTFGQPGTLGKILVLLGALVLPFTADYRRSRRRLAFAALILLAIANVLTMGRANIAGFFAMVAVWALLVPSRRAKAMKFWLPVSLVGIFPFALNALITRFQADPAGGQRDRLLEVALAHIPDNLWFGVGPSGYVEYFGQFDTLTAQGWPVHNTFLFTIAEFGVVGACLLALPFVFVLIHSFKRFALRKSALTDIALIALIVGFLPILLTGWGLFGNSVLPLFVLVIGILAPSRKDTTISLDSTDAPGKKALLRAFG